MAEMTRSDADRRLFGRRGLLVGGIGAAIAGALGRPREADAAAQPLCVGEFNVSPGPETGLEGDLFVGTAWAGGSLSRFSDSDSDGGVYTSTCRFWDICDPTFDPAGVQLDQATVQVLTDMTGRVPFITRHTLGEKAALIDGDCDIGGDCHVGGSCDLDGPATCNSTVAIGGDCHVGGASAVEGPCTVGSSCDVGQDLSVRGNFFCSTVGQVLCPADSDTCQIISSACTPESAVCVTPIDDPGRGRYVQCVKTEVGRALVKWSRAPTVAVRLNIFIGNPVRMAPP